MIKREPAFADDRLYRQFIYQKISSDLWVWYQPILFMTVANKFYVLPQN